MIIREATQNDAAEIVTLLDQLGYPANISECQKRILDHQQDGYKLFVSEMDNRVIGFAALHWYHAFHHSQPVGRLVAFCVDDKYRAKGYGSRLLSDVEFFLRDKGCFKIELTSNLHRQESHQYYFRKGYAQTSMHFVKILDESYMKRFEVNH